MINTVIYGVINGVSFCLGLLFVIRNFPDKRFRSKWMQAVENTGSVIEKVYFDDIFYIETRIRKTCVHKKNLSYVSKTTMSDYEKKLDERFYRCHAAYIVNMYYIRKIEEMKIYLSNGEFIFISKGRRSRFIQAYMEFLQGI